MTMLQDTFIQSDNPLINPPTLPNGAPALGLIKIEHMMPAIDYAIATSAMAIEAIKSIPVEGATFENTIVALERSGYQILLFESIIDQLISTKGGKAESALHKEIYAKLENSQTDQIQDEALFERIRYVHEHADRTSMTGEEQMLLHRKYTEFARSGALLTSKDNAVQRERLREINARVSEFGVSFSDNIKLAKAAYQRYVDDVSELEGVPERALKQFAHQAEESGQPGRYLITLQPAPIDIFYHCKNRSLREEIYKAEINLCADGEFDNQKIAQEILELRHEKAKLLGFSNYAEFVVSDRMSGSTNVVMNLLERNLAVYKPAAIRELDELKELAVEDGVLDFSSWDAAYYSRLLKEKRFNFSTEELRPYFELQNVLKGLFLHTEKLFGIQLREDTDGKYSVHHPDVKAYEVINPETQEVRGIIYMDLYARAGTKRGGAWHQALQRSHVAADGNVKIPITTNSSNFAKPAPNEPTLLDVDDVEELYHEFGHALHTLLGLGTYQSLTGTKVLYDAVEMPSQLQENWPLQEEVLNTYAFHYQTGEVIPKHLVDAIHKSRQFGTGMFGLAQTFYGTLDMELYMADPHKIGDLRAFENSILDRTRLYNHPLKFMTPNFSHIFSGNYAAGYNGYKWSNILDKDIFSLFEKNGLYHRETAQRLHDTIYSKGGTVHPMELFVAMVGREPDPDALLRHEGLLPMEEELPSSPVPSPMPPAPF